MDVSGVGGGQQVPGPLAVTSGHQQVSPQSAQQTGKEDSVEISAEAKTRAAHSHEGE